MKTYELRMSTTEVKPITVNVVDLMDDETVTSATATHTPPSGGSAISITSSIEAPYVHMAFGPFGVKGQHFVKVQAVGNGTPPSKPEVLYVIDVRDVG